MKLDISKVEFSRTDIKKDLKIPSTLTPELSYLIGIHIGDGTMNIYRRNDGFNGHPIGYSGHLIDEKEFHIKIIKPIFKGLFNREINIRFDRRKNHSCIHSYTNSKGIITFFNRVIGIPLGSKKDIHIPEIIRKSNMRIKREFIKGLGDTEFSLVFKRRYRNKHYYPVISFSTQSKNLQKEVIDILTEMRFNPRHISEYPTFRNGKQLFINQINLNGLDNLNQWMKKIGFNSTKHMTKYQIWKKHGFCPSKTNILERQKILKGEIDINSFYGAVA